MMLVWLYALSVLALPWLLYVVVRRTALRHMELRVLRKKYGDLPMFREFFARVEAEHVCKGSRNRPRVSRSARG